MRKRVTGKFKFLVFLACALYVGIMLLSQISTIEDQKAQKAELAQKLIQVKYQNSFLQNKLDYINSSEYIEEAARKRFGWVRPGERIYVADGQEGNANGSQSDSTPGPSPTPAPAGTPQDEPGGIPSPSPQPDGE